MTEIARPEGEEVVDESVSHYRVQKLKNGKVRVKAGGHVVTAETYWKALARLAESEQERLEDKPDHLKDDQWDSIYWNVTDPRLEDVIQPSPDNRVIVECDVCGETKEMWPSQAEEYDHHFCSDECESKWRSDLFSSEDNPVWAGGYAPYYGSDWHSKREKVVERDGDECRVCGITADKLGKSVDVHHIESVSSFDDPNDAHSLDNMIQLCPTCHTQAEHDKIEVPQP